MENPPPSPSRVAAATTTETSATITHVILFYRYHELSTNYSLMEEYRSAMISLCEALNLKGRILIGCSATEGINGTLAGTLTNVTTFTTALLGHDYYYSNSQTTMSPSSPQHLPILNCFWKACQAFATKANIPVLTISCPNDFKWSQTNTSQPIFPDLNIKLVSELIGTGGVLSEIKVQPDDPYSLTPEQWHQELLHNDKNNHILIDCRNTKEYQIGHFQNALDPKTTTFAQFPVWVQQQQHHLLGATLQPQQPATPNNHNEKKKIFMYCTGGIRCEKASQYVRSQTSAPVYHLKGGIHKYIEQYGNDGLWKGKNYVFDGRVEDDITVDNMVGQCTYCHIPYDTFHPSCVCTVCREPILLCHDCRSSHKEYHCQNHVHLKTCYFTDLQSYNQQQLQEQMTELEILLGQIAIGKRYKQKRKTLQKQMDKIQCYLQQHPVPAGNDTTKCRNCGDKDCTTGACWGFHGIKRKQILETEATAIACIKQQQHYKTSTTRQPRTNSNHRISKLDQHQRILEEIITLGLSQPPWMYRAHRSGIRVPPPCIRLIQTKVKGKWCGKSAEQVALEEFPELARNLSDVMKHGLLKVNGGTTHVCMKLKNMDEICRIVHWHEPPVIVPERIHVQKISLEKSILEELSLAEDSSMHHIIVCDKPSSVPVHPAGPYFSNTLTMMVEAQESLSPRSLIPCHRIDRGTSGLTICCTNVGIARLLQSTIDEGRVKKLYVARVMGKLPSTNSDCRLLSKSKSLEFVSIEVLPDSMCVLEMNAPVLMSDPTLGLRVVSKAGKPSKSRFRCLAFDELSNTSIILCYPMTGRGHQLRVHLQFLGFPIIDDTLYDGGKSESITSHYQQAITQICQSKSLEKKEALMSTALLSPVEASLAREICQCCNKGEAGVTQSFTKSQLLESGHSISLHAVKYELSILRKKRMKSGNEDRTDCISQIHLSVGLPMWAQNVDESALCWL